MMIVVTVVLPMGLGGNEILFNIIKFKLFIGDILMLSPLLDLMMDMHALILHLRALRGINLVRLFLWMMKLSATGSCPHYFLLRTVMIRLRVVATLRMRVIVVIG
jgi:hypothetical protein